MSWADNYIKKLQSGETISFRPVGNSMTPKIMSKQLCTLAPIDTNLLKVGDIVLVKVSDNIYLHLISAIQENRFQISNNRGKVNGWTNAKSIYGKCIKVE